jgi:hypothetical protein
MLYLYLLFPLYLCSFVLISFLLCYFTFVMLTQCRLILILIFDFDAQSDQPRLSPVIFHQVHGLQFKSIWGQFEIEVGLRKSKPPLRVLDR